MDNNDINKVEDPTENLKNPQIIQPQEFFTNDNSQQNIDYSMPQQNAEYGAQMQNMGYGMPQMNQGDFNPQQNVDYNMPQMNQPNMYAPYGADANMPMQDNKAAKSKKIKKVKKAWSKGKTAAVVSGGAALVAGIACVIIFIIVPMLKPAKDVVVDAFENTYDAAMKNMCGEDIYGMQDILEAYYSKGGDTSFTMYLDKLPDTAGDIDIKKYQLKADGSYNPVDKLFNYSTAIRYDDKDIIGIDLIGTKDNTYIMMDELVNGYFMLPNEDIFNKLKASPLGKLMDLGDVPNYPVSINYFPDINIASNTDGPEIVTEYVDAFEKLWDGVDVSKQGKAKINLHDDVVVATEYYLTFSEKDIEEAIGSYMDGLMSEDVLADMIAASAGEFDEATYKAAITQLKAMIPSLISDDLVVRVYVKDDKVVKITSNPKGNIYGVEIGCDLSVDITDTHVRLDSTVKVAGEKLDIVCDIKSEDGKTDGEMIFAAGGQSVSIKLDGTTVSDDSKYSDTLKISMYENSKCVATIDVNSTLDKKSNKFEGSATISGDGADNITFSYSGELKNEKGVALSMTLDDMTVSCDGMSVSVGSAYYSIDTSKVSAKGIDSSIPVYDVLTLNEEDLEQIANDNQNRIMNWLQDIGKLDIISALTSISNDVIEDDYNDDIWDVTIPYDEDTATDVEVMPIPDATDTDVLSR